MWLSRFYTPLGLLRCSCRKKLVLFGMVYGHFHSFCSIDFGWSVDNHTNKKKKLSLVLNNLISRWRKCNSVFDCGVDFEMEICFVDCLVLTSSAIIVRTTYELLNCGRDNGIVFFWSVCLFGFVLFSWPFLLVVLICCYTFKQAQRNTLKFIIVFRTGG